MIILSLFALSIFIGIILGIFNIKPTQINKKPNTTDIYIDDDNICYKYIKKIIN